MQVAQLLLKSFQVFKCTIMSFIKKYLCKANKLQRLTVTGWVKQQQQILDLPNIPLPLQSLCIVYFNEYDEFEECGSFIKISEDKKSITKTLTIICNAHCFGALQIPSLYNNRIFKWDIQINKMAHGSPTRDVSDVMIGVSSKQNVENKKINFHSYIRKALDYAYTDTGQILIVDTPYLEWKNYGDTAGKDDIISVELDLNKSQIRFYINDKDQGIAYENIKKGKDISYRFVVAASYKDTELTLINFTTRNS